MSSFKNIPSGNGEKEIRSSVELGRQLVIVLKHGSVEEYISMFPTLEDFTSIMTAHAPLYGANLEDAKQDFSTLCEQAVPDARNSFESLLSEAQKKY